MAARTRKIRHDDDTRAKIKAAHIINRLYQHVMGEIELESAQVSSAKALLNKVLPDLQAVTLEANHNVRSVSEKPMTNEEWAERHASHGVH